MELREKDERLAKLEKKLERQRKKPSKTRNVTVRKASRSSKQPDDGHIQSTSSHGWKVLIGLALFGIYLGVAAQSWWVGLGAIALLGVSMLQIAMHDKGELLISNSGIAVKIPSGITEYPWAEIDNVVVVQRGNSVKVRVRQQDRWVTLSGAWQIQSEKLATLLGDWLTFARAQVDPSSVAAPQQRVRIAAGAPQSDDGAREAEEQAEAERAEQPPRSLKSRAR
jgi:hypothetical protein